MFILLIILVTILIFALRLTLIGTELAGRVALREVKRAKKKENNRIRKIEGVKDPRNVMSGKKRALSAVGATVATTKSVVKSGIRLVIFALQWMRGSLIVMAMAFALFDVLIFAIITAGAGGAYVLFYEDSANGKTLVAENNNSTSSEGNNATVDINNLNWDSISDKEARELLKDVASRWGDEVTDKRAKLIILGATRIGHSIYSQGRGDGRGGTADDQSVFDCSSFVGWCYYKSGYTKVLADSTTASFINDSETSNQFEDTTADKLIPGDVCLWHNTLDTGNANHAGIYIGKDKDGQMLFMHCSSTSQSSPHPVSTGVRFSHYSWEVFRRFKNW